MNTALRVASVLAPRRVDVGGAREPHAERPGRHQVVDPVREVLEQDVLVVQILVLAVRHQLEPVLAVEHRALPVLLREVDPERDKRAGASVQPEDPARLQRHLERGWRGRARFAGNREHGRKGLRAVRVAVAVHRPEIGRQREHERLRLLEQAAPLSASARRSASFAASGHGSASLAAGLPAPSAPSEAGRASPERPAESRPRLCRPQRGRTGPAARQRRSDNLPAAHRNLLTRDGRARISARPRRVPERRPR